MPKAATPASPKPPESYEAALAELEALVARVESGNLPLDALMDSYKQGATLLSFCRDKLAAVEDQIKLLDNGSLKNWAQE